jgi:hypothetical protein
MLAESPQMAVVLAGVVIPASVVAVDQVVDLDPFAPI